MLFLKRQIRNGVIFMNKLYLLLQVIGTHKQFFKYFDTEFEMDKFKRRLKFSKKLIIIEDSRDRSLLEYE